MKATTLCLVVAATLLVGTAPAMAQPMPQRYYLPPSVAYPGTNPSPYAPPLYAPPSLFSPTYSPPPSFGGFVITNKGAYPFFTYGAGTSGQPYTSRYYFGGQWYYR
jgi:hypothetical protein